MRYALAVEAKPSPPYRYFTENSVDPISIVSGLVQTGLYLDFFYIFFTKVMKGEKFEVSSAFHR